MKKIVLSAWFFGITVGLTAQDTARQQPGSNRWTVDASANFYLAGASKFVNPIVTAKKGKLHLETRYNYEEFNTLSVWGGYNFATGKKWEFKVTPMAGLVAGKVNGWATGVEFSITRKWVEFYTEGEWFASFSNRKENFTYLWSDLYVYPKSWCWLGLSGQRLKTFETPTEIQKGLLAGAGYKALYFTAYVYNPFSPGHFYFMMNSGIKF